MSQEKFLIETGWLAQHLDDANLRIVDARWFGDHQATLEIFRKAHLPGAIHLDWRYDLASTQRGVIDVLLSPEAFKTVMEKAGIGDNTRVVVYGEMDHGGPQRLWWALNFYGHPDVMVLNGGLTKWQAEGRPTTQDTFLPERASFTPKIQPGWMANLEDVRAGLSPETAALFMDNRPPEQFEGRALWTPYGSHFLESGETWKEIEGQTLRAGRIPGALNIPASGLFDPESWTFPAPRQLRAKLEKAGFSPKSSIITYCGVGISAATGLFALKLAGFPHVTLYDASWSEWARDPENPVERG